MAACDPNRTSNDLGISWAAPAGAHELIQRSGVANTRATLVVRTFGASHSVSLYELPAAVSPGTECPSVRRDICSDLSDRNISHFINAVVLSRDRLRIGGNIGGMPKCRRTRAGSY